MTVCHAYFSEVTRVILVKVHPVMLHTTSIAMSSGMFPVCARVVMADVPPRLLGVPYSGRHLVGVRRGRERAWCL